MAESQKHVPCRKGNSRHSQLMTKLTSEREAWQSSHNTKKCSETKKAYESAFRRCALKCRVGAPGSSANIMQLEELQGDPAGQATDRSVYVFFAKSDRASADLELVNPMNDV